MKQVRLDELSLKKNWDRKLSSGLMLLTFMTTQLFLFCFANAGDMVALSQREPNFVESGLGPGNLPFEMKLFTLPTQEHRLFGRQG